MKPISLSLFDLLKIGPGPSSSHTIGPMRAGYDFLEFVRALPEVQRSRASRIEARLFGSLSATGRGHGTDRALVAGLLGQAPETCPPDFLDSITPDGDQSTSIGTGRIPVSMKDVVFDSVEHAYPFNNTLVLRLLDSQGGVLFEREYYSVGGGFIQWKGWEEPERGSPAHAYSNMAELKDVCREKGLGLHEVALDNEMAVTGRSREEIFRELDEVMEVMAASVERGLMTEGVLPGPIGLHRKALALYERLEHFGLGEGRLLLMLDAAAFAAAEENAAGGVIVTAPTCGSAGVIPAVIHTMKHVLGVGHESLREGLMAAALVGFLAKENASIAGAEVGCQGEIGVASAMAAAMMAQAFRLGVHQVENAAETALEHHLGLTCDPVGGYVQIPCIERNGMGAVKAFNAYVIATTVNPGFHRVDLDRVLKVMLLTGRDMCAKYRETSLGGLAVSGLC